LPPCTLRPPSSAVVVPSPALFLRQQWQARARSFLRTLGPVPR
jgi:hypothetical protein